MFRNETNCEVMVHPFDYVGGKGKLERELWKLEMGEMLLLFAFEIKRNTILQGL